MDAESAVVAGLVASTAMFILLIGFILWVLLVVAHWRMFVKAGEAGWKAIVPFYCDYTMYKLTWNTNMFWFSLIFTLLAFFTTAFSGTYAVSANGQIIIQDGGNFLFDILSFIASIGTLFFTVMLSLKTALAYGKGTLYAIGLVLLPNVFTLIIAFGDARYRGPQE